MTGSAPAAIGAAEMTLPGAVGVVGGGTMGAGIAHALLLAGCSVVLVERNDEAAVAARARVERAVAGSVERGRLEAADQVLARLTTTIERDRLSGVGLVIEATPESLELKLETLHAIAEVVADTTVIGSNTSSLSIDGLSSGVSHPERLLGLHFFNPVPASKLVEVVVGTHTSAHLSETAAAWVRQLGKTPIVVRDAPGFASSRLGVALGLEAIRMVEEGVAQAEDIDAAMTLGYGHPMGPLRVTDLVGLDVRLGIARHLERELGPRFAPPTLMVTMVEQGHLGRKTGRGFYHWEAT